MIKFQTDHILDFLFSSFLFFLMLGLSPFLYNRIQEDSDKEGCLQRAQSLLILLQTKNFHSIPHESALCANYIFHGQNARVNDINAIVQKVCEGKFLHEYCNFELGYAMAKGIITFKFKRPIPQDKWRELIRQCVLLTSLHKSFPSVWPWMHNIPISPSEWKKVNDISHLLLNPSVPDIYQF